MPKDPPSDLFAFHQFVGKQLELSGPLPTPEECLQLWRERCEVIEAIREGLAEADAGLGIPLEEFLREARSWRHADVR
jgi:hypothetical protein